MCWHVRERVSPWEINKGGTADFESVLYLKGQIFYFAGRLPPEMIPGRFLIRVQAGKPKSPGTDEDRRKNRQERNEES